MRIPRTAINTIAAAAMGLGAALPFAQAANAGDADEQRIAIAFDDVATHIRENGFDARVLQMLPQFPWPVRVSNENLTPEVLDKVSEGRGYQGYVFLDYTLRPRESDVNKVCYVIAKTNPEGIVENYKRFVGFPIEDESIINPYELALFFRLHEIRHCAQSTEIMDRVALETDADEFAIKVIRTINPNSNIDKVVLALRAADKVYGNALQLAYALHDYVPPPTHQVLHATMGLQRVGTPLQAKIAQQVRFGGNGVSNIESEHALEIATTVMLASMEVNDSPGVIMMHNLAATKLEAFKFLAPSLTQRTIEILKRSNMVRADVASSTAIRLAMQ